MVVAGSLALGIRLAFDMRGRLTALREMERIISYIEGELKYRHATLDEALHNVSEKTYYPYNAWLGGMYQSVNVPFSSCTDNSEHIDFYNIWCNSLIKLKPLTYLNSRDIASLYDVGKALGYLDIESQQMNLEYEKEQLHGLILEMDKDVSKKMKNSVVLCFLAGVMVVIAIL